jgi:hypothetical protein
MTTRQYSHNLVIGAISFNTISNITTDGENALTATSLTAKALSSWVKTDADTAAGNLAADHGWSTGTFDVYWTGGARYDVTVTITTNACALDGGTGTDFPATANATVVLAKRVDITGFTLDGDNCSLVAVKMATSDLSLAIRGRIGFRDASSNIIRSVPLTSNAAADVNNIYGGESNLYTGAVITNAVLSSESATYTLDCSFGYMYDPTQ